MKHYNLISRAIAHRSEESAVASKSGAPSKDFKTIEASLYLFEAQYFEAGLNKICAAAHKTPEEVATIISIADETSEQFIPQKALDKFVRICQYLGGAKIENALDPKAINRRKGVLDSFCALMFSRVADFYQLPRDERGRITGARNPVELSNPDAMNMISGFYMSKSDMESMIAKDKFGPMNVNHWDENRVDAEIEAKAGDFDVRTASTQTSQLRSLFIALGIADGKKWEKPKKGDTPKMVISHAACKMIIKAVAENPISDYNKFAR